MTAWHLAYRTASRDVIAQRSWHQAPAVLLASVPVAGGFGAAAPGRWSSPARWPGPGEVLASLLVGFLSVCVGLLTHGALGLRRMAAWDTDWRATEPRWTRRH
jgi:hypothetical protein